MKVRQPIPTIMHANNGMDPVLLMDQLVLEDVERGPDEDLPLQFEAFSQMPDEEKKIIMALLDGMIVKHQTKQMMGSLSS